MGGWFWWCCCLKWPPSELLKCCLGFLEQEECDVPFRQNTCVRAASFGHELQRCSLWVQCKWITIWYLHKTEEEFHWSVSEAALESAKVTSIVCHKTTGDIKKRLHFWIHEKKKNKKTKSIVDSSVVRLKAKEI